MSEPRATYTPQAVIDQAIAALDLPRCDCPGCGRVKPDRAVRFCIPCLPDALGQTNHAHGYGAPVGQHQHPRHPLPVLVIPDEGEPIDEALRGLQTVVLGYLQGRATREQLRAAVGLPSESPTPGRPLEDWEVS